MSVFCIGERRYGYSLPRLYVVRAQAGAAALQREVPGLRRVGRALGPARGAGGRALRRVAARQRAAGQRRARRLAAQGAGPRPHRLRHDTGTHTERTAPTPHTLSF